MKLLLKKQKWYLLVILGIFSLSLIIFRQFVFDGYYFLSKGFMTDLLRVSLPTYYQLYDSITSGGNFWSWKMGIGTNMFVHADVFFDPFTYILFIFGRESIPNMMIWLFITKLIFQGISFFAYIDYFKLDKKASTIASIIYAFSGYSLIMGNNFALGTILVYTPLIFLGIEKWLDTGKKTTLTISLFLTCIYSYYFFYIVGIFSLMYLCIRIYQRKEKFFKNLMILAGIALFVILASSFTLLPQIELVLSSSRTSMSKDIHFGLNLFIPQIKAYVTAILRSFCGDILGNVNTNSYIGFCHFNGHDFFQMSTYSSAFIVILLTQLFYYKREKIKSYIIIFIIISLITIFPIFSYILNAFSTVNARWMFIVSLIECLAIGFSVDSILEKGKLHGTSLVNGVIASNLIIVISLIIVSIPHDETDFVTQLSKYAVNAQKYILAISLLYILFSFLYLFQNIKRKKLAKITITILVLMIILIDENINYYQCYGAKESTCEYREEEKTCYEDTSTKIIQTIQKNDNTLFRINKTFDSVYDINNIPSENDAMAQKYFGLKNYTSLNNPSYMAFLQRLGIYVGLPILHDYYKSAGIPPEAVTGQSLNYIDGVGDRYQIMNYLGVKYLITDSSTPNIPQNFEKNLQTRDFICYQNKNYYPIAFSHSSKMSLTEFEQLTDNNKDFALLNYTIVDSIQTQNSPIETNEEVLLELSKEKQNAFELLSFNEDKIKFNIRIPQGSEYLSTSIPYDKNWNIYIDGKKVETCKINISLLGARITPGNHRVDIIYKLKSFNIGVIISTACFLFLLIYVIQRNCGIKTLFKNKLCEKQRICTHEQNKKGN